MRIEVFQICLQVQIERIIVRKIVQLLGNGNFKIKNGNRSIILEAIVDQSLSIWHVYFGLPNGNNDINELDWLPLVTNLF